MGMCLRLYMFVGKCLHVGACVLFSGCLDAIYWYLWMEVYVCSQACLSLFVSGRLRGCCCSGGHLFLSNLSAGNLSQGNNRALGNRYQGGNYFPQEEAQSSPTSYLSFSQSTAQAPRRLLRKFLPLMATSQSNVL